MRKTAQWLAGVVLAAAATPALHAQQIAPGDAFPALRVSGPLDRIPALRPMDAAKARAEFFASLLSMKLGEGKLTAAEKAWPADANVAGFETVERMAHAFAACDDRAQSLVEVCSGGKQVKLPDTAWLDGAPAIVRNHLRLYYGRWLSSQRYYEESLDQLAKLKPEEVADPATLLFCVAVAHHHLSHKTLGLSALDRLLDDVADAPARYRELGMLLHHDLTQLDDESLDAVARQMRDIERRLELGRTGKKVLKIEDDVVAALDRMIKRLEDPGEGPHCPNCPGPPDPTPAPPGPPGPPTPRRTLEPRAPGGGSSRGEGEVDGKKFGAERPWGDLEPKEREKALQQIGRDFPSHYGQVIEDYFRKIAGEGGQVASDQRQ